MTNTIIHIDIDALDERLDHGKRWITTGWGNWKSPHGKTCLHGAIRHCQPVPGDARIIEQVADRYGFGTSDNDDASSWAAVKNTIVADITDDMLAETFGPNWEPIVALVRRSVLLTADEANSLHATRAATRGTAWDAAWDAARDAAHAAARDAAWDAFRDAAMDAVGAAAWGTAGALAVRDLIRRYGFTQDHYDTLTGPWAAVIGRVHPDDVAIHTTIFS